MTEIKNSPELRFPEFDGEWDEKKISELFSINAGGDIDKKHVSQVKTEEFRYPIYANASENKGFYAYSNVYKIEPPVITVAGRGVYIGIAHARDHQFYPIVRLLVLQPKVDQNINFFEYRINKIKLFTESTGVPQLTAPQMSNYRILYPEILEQTKIADFLTSVDRRISLLSQKKEKLEVYKNGIMQGIFSKDKIHRISFTDENGNPYPEWEEMNFGKIYSFVPTNSYSREKLNYGEGEVKNIHYGDIHTKFRTQFDLIKENVPFINPDVDISRISEENYVGEGDLIMADASEDYADIGKSIEIINLNGDKVLSGLHTLLAKQRNSDLLIGFGGHLMKSRYMRLDIMRIAQGSKVLSISTGRLANISCSIPCKPEQQKIASFLSAIDKKIELVARQVEKSKEFKAGLLQKMFV
ncbi:restriction endonuclease subunit S [Methanococcoides sp. SA1]|nr:restriction endonuclease subunit S [Methanococcoides sp. SA1]